MSTLQGKIAIVTGAGGAIGACTALTLVYPDGTPRTRHMMSEVVIEPEGTSCASAKIYVMVFQLTDALPLQPIIGGAYDDAFSKVDGQWRFLRRRLSNDLYGNCTAHGKRPFGPVVPHLATLGER